MVEGLRLSLLGGLQISRGGLPVVGFVSSKVPALLCYLAATGRAHSRTELAGLLWGELPDAAANANLRQALSNLRRLLAPYLLITLQTVAFNRDSPYWLDVEVLQEKVDKYASRLRNRALSTGSRSARSSSQAERPPGVGQTLLDLREAVELYDGEFLQDFGVRDAPAFEEWVLGQRERWRQTALQALDILSAHYLAQNQIAEAIGYTTRLLALEPWQERAHRQMMQLLVRSGQREAALAQYETCRRVLAQELGVEPMAETKALHERIQAAGGARSHNLPAPTTSFVGREEELAEVARLLAEPTCRLLTVHGPGGIGKTRLAEQAALQICAEPGLAFPHGVYLAPLALVTSADSLVTATAQSVGLASRPEVEPKTQLVSYLRDKELLLILDGFEHLVAQAGLLADILQTAPQIKLLVTSRQPLNLQSEWLLELGGLTYPSLPLATQRPEDFSAVQLFVQRARQVRPSFARSASEANNSAVIRICQLVDGLPLGVELAAGWVHRLSCAQIAGEIGRGLDVLSVRQHDRPERHQSMRGVLEHSWNLLSETERQVLCKMSVFRGGFGREAAKQVAGADLGLLSSLMDKSLLRAGSAGRYELHPLVQQYTEEKLACSPRDLEQTQAGHSRYYAGFVRQRGARLQGLQQEQALAEIDQEIENVRVAWRWAIAKWRLPEVWQSLQGLGLYYHSRGWLVEGEASMGLAVASLDQAEVAPGSAAAVTLGSAMMFQGLYQALLGQYEPSGRLLEKSLAVLRPTDAIWVTVMAAAWLGLAATSQGQYRQGRIHAEEALALARASQDRWLVGMALACLGLCVRWQDYAEAAQYFRESLEAFKEVGDWHRMAAPSLYLGEALRLSGNLAEARRHLEGSLTFARDHHIQQLEAWTLWNLGEVAYASGEYPDALHCFQAGLAVARQVGDYNMIVSCETGLGSVALMQGKASETQTHFHAAFQQAVETRAWPLILGLLVRRTEMLISQCQSQQERGVEWLAVVLHHPALTQESRTYAERLLDRLRTVLPPKAFVAAWERGLAQNIENLVEKLRGSIPNA